MTNYELYSKSNNLTLILKASYLRITVSPCYIWGRERKLFQQPPREPPFG